jgi:uncharacterized protein (UPF0276 family)
MDWRNLPRLGFGLGVSTNHARGFEAADSLLATADPRIDYVEIYAGTRQVPPRDVAHIRAWQERGIPLTFHTASLDLWDARGEASEGGPSTRLMEEFLRPVWCNQDLMLTRTEGLREGVLLCGLFTHDGVANFAACYRQCSKSLATPLLIENAPYRLIVGDLPFGDFFALLGAAADCPFTLDIGHLYGTAVLLGREVERLLDNYPFERVVEVHIAGGYLDPQSNMYVDDHDHDIEAEACLILDRIAGRCPNLKAITYEVQNPQLQRLLANMERIGPTINRWREDRPRPRATVAESHVR